MMTLKICTLFCFLWVAMRSTPVSLTGNHPGNKLKIIATQVKPFIQSRHFNSSVCFLIDLSEKSKTLLQQLGPETSKYLFNYLAPGEHPNYPEGKQDDTHFNELGARKIAEIVLTEIKNLQPGLAERIAKPAVKN